MICRQGSPCGANVQSSALEHALMVSYRHATAVVLVSKINQSFQRPALCSSLEMGWRHALACGEDARHIPAPNPDLRVPGSGQRVTPQGPRSSRALATSMHLEAKCMIPISDNYAWQDGCNLEYNSRAHDMHGLRWHDVIVCSCMQSRECFHLGELLVPFRTCWPKVNVWSELLTVQHSLCLRVIIR